MRITAIYCMVLILVGRNCQSALSKSWCGPFNESSQNSFYGDLPGSLDGSLAAILIGSDGKRIFVNGVHFGLVRALLKDYTGAPRVHEIPLPNYIGERLVQLVNVVSLSLLPRSSARECALINELSAHSRKELDEILNLIIELDMSNQCAEPILYCLSVICADRIGRASMVTDEVCAYGRLIWGAAQRYARCLRKPNAMSITDLYPRPPDVLPPLFAHAICYHVIEQRGCWIDGTRPALDVRPFLAIGIDETRPDLRELLLQDTPYSCYEPGSLDHFPNVTAISLKFAKLPHGLEFALASLTKLKEVYVRCIPCEENFLIIRQLREALPAVKVEYQVAGLNDGGYIPFTPSEIADPVSESF